MALPKQLREERRRRGEEKRCGLHLSGAPEGFFENPCRLPGYCLRSCWAFSFRVPEKGIHSMLLVLDAKVQILILSDLIFQREEY